MWLATGIPAQAHSRVREGRVSRYAGNNEIDKALLDLLSQNIAAARAAGQPQAADFMQKVRDAAQKFVLAT